MVAFIETLDVNFDTVAGLRSPENPRFLVEIIDTFVAHSATVVARLESEINQPIPFYDDAVRELFQLKGSSSSMGGGRVAAACLELRRACDDSDKQRCLESLEKVKDEYQTLRDTLIEISRMEKIILDESVTPASLAAALN
ncbi:unnamed protein product [Linum tenue]|uniref:Histidine-containing phosphotransfer protein n=1 Tax=Linum tenue TaxID=586396 RepID=A0AAV0QJB2_9ROSI|nr:unnamed protein product [Linum tenue]